MKKINLKKTIAAGLVLAGAAFTPNLRADVTVFIEGGSASQSVLYDRATNLFLNPSYPGGTLTNVVGSATAAVREFQGTSQNPALAGYGAITLDINVANGAVAGLQALTTQISSTGDTNVYGSNTIPILVDSAASPNAIGGLDSSQLTALPTYVVPLVYIKNTNSVVTAGITNLTQRQAVSLETSSPLQGTYYGGTDTNYIYFVGRNLEAAVRTEIDLNIYNTATINTYTTNTTPPYYLPVLDTSDDPGLSAGGVVANTVLVLTNSIGTVSVQNIKKGLTPIAYEGVPYSVSNVINGSYPLWGYENYYYITTGSGYAGAPSAAQLAVISAFYNSVTNASFQSTTNPVFGSNFIPNSALQVQRTVDGGQITPLPGFFQ
jgi:hypothetical protein